MFMEVPLLAGIQVVAIVFLNDHKGSPRTSQYGVNSVPVHIPNMRILASIICGWMVWVLQDCELEAECIQN